MLPNLAVFYSEIINYHHKVWIMILLYTIIDILWVKKKKKITVQNYLLWIRNNNPATAITASCFQSLIFLEPWSQSHAFKALKEMISSLFNLFHALLFTMFFRPIQYYLESIRWKKLKLHVAQIESLKIYLRHTHINIQ